MVEPKGRLLVSGKKLKGARVHVDTHVDAHVYTYTLVVCLNDADDQASLWTCV